MKIGEVRQEGRNLGIGLLISVGVHLGLVLIVLIWASLIQPEVKEEENGEEEEESIEIVLQDPEESSVQEEWADEWVESSVRPMKEEEEALALEPVEEDEQEEDEQEEELETPPMEERADLYAVEQVTNEEDPEEADHISDQANRVEEEMVAEVTTLEDVEPAHDDVEAPEVAAPVEVEMAMIPPEELVEPEVISSEDSNEQEEEALAEAGAEEQEYLDPAEIFRSDEGREQFRSELDRDRLFARDPQTRERMGSQVEERPVEAPQGRRFLTRWEEQGEALRANLENFLPHVQVGNHTTVNARAAPHASYLAQMHRTIHQGWAYGFIPRVQERYSNAHPLNDMTLEVVVEIVIDAARGEVVDTQIVSGSGNTMYDAEAVMVSRRVGRLPAAPAAMISPDGNVYVHWTYWRDVRQCGSFGARIYRLEEGASRRSGGR